MSVQPKTDPSHRTFDSERRLKKKRRIATIALIDEYNLKSGKYKASGMI